MYPYPRTPCWYSATILLCTRGCTSSYRRLLPLLDSIRTENLKNATYRFLSKSKDNTIKQKKEDGMDLRHIHSYFQLLHNNSASRPRQPKPQQTNNHTFQSAAVLIHIYIYKYLCRKIHLCNI